jgi:hypothetical protein
MQNSTIDKRQLAEDEVVVEVEIEANVASILVGLDGKFIVQEYCADGIMARGLTLAEAHKVVVAMRAYIVNEATMQLDITYPDTLVQAALGKQD